MATNNETSPGLDPNAATMDATRRREAPSRDPARKIGRFALLRLIGVGGMGSVFVAYDEQLDRKVAVKLLRREVDEISRGRMLREAQAMARVDHPNVLRVYEAGEDDEQLFIAMEFVDGQDLRQWRRKSSPAWREVLNVYIEAGKGLCAAHEVGLVHRDFKPHNVMIDGNPGGDGKRRVRVLDFGLAGRGDAEEIKPPADLRVTQPSGALSTPLTETGVVMGTPAYMAPEQFAGRPGTPRSDQFAFCIALWEALYDSRPFDGDSALELVANVTDGVRSEPSRDPGVPGWLRAVLDRGLAPSADERWGSMRELLAALERGAHRRQRVIRYAGAAGLAAALAASFVAARGDAPCAAAARALDATWNEETRERLRESMSDVDADFATATAAKADEALASYASSWQQARIEACEAGVERGEQSDEVMVQRVRCLDGRLRSFNALLEVLSSPTPERLEAGTRAATELPGISQCADLQYIAAEIPPPQDEATAHAVTRIRDELARAAALRNAAEYEAAAILAQAQVAAANDLDYAPIRVEANNEAGWAAYELAKLDDTLAHHRAAYIESSRASARVRAETHRLLASWARYNGRYREASREAEKAVVIVEDAYGTKDVDAAESRALLSAVVRRAGNAAKALELARGTLEAREELFGSEHPSIAESRNLIGNALLELGRYDDAVAEFRLAVPIWRAAFGPQHPKVGEGLNNLAGALSDLGQYAEAVEASRQAVAIYQASVGEHHPSTARCRGNLAYHLKHQAKYDEALALARQALSDLEATFGPRNPQVAQAHGTVGVVLDDLGRYRESLAEHELALEIRTETLGPDHPLVAVSLNNIGILKRELGDRAGSLAAHKRSLEIRERIHGPHHPDVARSLDHLAATHVDYRRFEEALSLYTRSLAIKEKTYGPDHPSLAYAYNNLGTVYDDLDRLDDALAAHRRSLDIRARALGATHPDVGSNYNNIGSVLQSQGKFDEAITYYRKSLDVYRDALAPDHPSVALAHNNIGIALFRAGRHEPAVEELAHAAKIWEKANGFANTDVASTHYSMGMVLREAGAPSRALEHFQTAAASLDASKTPVPTDHTIAHAMVAITSDELGKRAEANEALGRVRELADANDDEVVSAMNVVATAMLRGQRPSGRARTQVAQAAATLEASGEGMFGRLAKAWLDGG